MTQQPMNPEEQALLAQIRATLKAERETRGENARQAFSQQLHARINEHEKPSETAAGPKRRLRWRPIMVAAAVFLSVFGAVAMFREMVREIKPNPRALRLEAKRIPLQMNEGLFSHPALFAANEAQTLVLITYDHFGERCLWLYPQNLIRLGEDAEADQEFAERKKWYTTVRGGTIAIPPDALEEAFGDSSELVIMAVHKHFEIWTKSSLARYLEKSGSPI